MTQPSPLWYATRGAGIVSLVLLTASIVLGIVTSVRWKTDDWPRFLIVALHRNLSLLVVAFGLVHAITAVLDPVAGLGVKDALAPFVSAYRPLWLGFGVVSAELMIAIAATSLLRQHIGYLAWRVIHWLTYATWPLAMLHSLGTGTDPQQRWFLLLAAACVGSVIAALFWRLNRGLEHQPSFRLLLQGSTLAGIAVLAGWTALGPLQPGWARAAGTPSYLLASANPSPSAAPGLPTGLNDALQGNLSRTASGGVQVQLSDVQTPGLEVIIGIPDTQSNQVTVSVNQNGTNICSVPGQVDEAITAQCGQTPLSISLRRASERSTAVTGEIQT